MDYYHSIEEFPDFLVGLISYNPLRIIFLERQILIRHPNDENRIKSPFKIVWENHGGLNAFHKIGITNFKNNPKVYLASSNEFLPKSAKLSGVNTEIILNSILRENNFRTWVLISGFAKEIAFKSCLDKYNVKYLKPANSQRKDLRADKSDLALIRNETGKVEFLQVKGLSVSRCKFRETKSIVCVETQLTRGRVNDHPTQSRLYYFTDFDLLIVGINPSLVKVFRLACGLSPDSIWEFYAIPTKNLKSHRTMKHRINSTQNITYFELQNYKISNQWIEQWQKIK